MAIKEIAFTALQLQAAGGSVLISVFAHWAALSTTQHILETKSRFSLLIGAGLSGLGVYYLLNDVLPWTVTIFGTWFFAGLVGYVWGPAFLIILVQLGMSRILRKLGFSQLEIDKIEKYIPMKQIEMYQTPGVVAPTPIIVPMLVTKPDEDKEVTP